MEYFRSFKCTVLNISKGGRKGREPLKTDILGDFVGWKLYENLTTAWAWAWGSSEADGVVSVVNRDCICPFLAL